MHLLNSVLKTVAIVQRAWGWRQAPGEDIVWKWEEPLGDVALVSHD
jgi:hypothetical protein